MLQIGTLSRLDLGIKDENNARDLYIDMNAWYKDYPNATFVILHKRNGDQTKYPVHGDVTFDRDTGVMKWTPNAWDTFYKGKGTAEIRCVENEVIKKTKDIITEVQKSLILPSGDTPANGWQGILNAVMAAQNGAEIAQEAAEEAAEAAEEAAEAAEEAVSHNPYINELTGTWMVWDAEEGEYTDTDVPARGPQGETGQTGPAGRDGQDGSPGSDGVSPVISSEAITGGHRVTIVDAEGTTTVDVMDGVDGQDGSPGQDGQDGSDGVSPTISSESITGGHRLTIVDAEGTTTVDVMDGVDGQDGSPGQDGQDGSDGVSPTVSYESITGGHRITIVDAQGTTTVDVMDGVDGQDGSPGQPGQDGYTPVRGTDYWTAADKAEIVEEAAEAVELSGTLNTPASVQSFTDGSTYPMQMTFAVEAIQAGTGDPSPQNVRSITGRTGANISVTGKNLFNATVEGAGHRGWYCYRQSDGTYTISPRSTSSQYDSVLVIGQIKIYKDVEYILSGCPSGFEGISVFIALPGATAEERISDYGNGVTITSDKDDIYEVGFRIPLNFSPPAGFRFSPMVRFATETDPTYEPFGHAYPITFPSSAGTVYGGTVTVNPDGTGELVVDRAYAELTSVSQLTRFNVDETYGTYANIALTGIQKEDSQTVVWSSNAIGVPRNERVEEDNITKFRVHGAGQSGYATIWAPPSLSVTTAEALYAYYENAQFIYLLATPVTYSLSTPQVIALLNLNNVWADTGNITSISYVRNTVPEMIRQDTKGQIIQSIFSQLADVEAPYAIANHSSGDVFSVNGKLLKATGSIATGDAIVENTNCTAITLVEYIQSLIQ